MGEQISATLANQVAILASYVNTFDDGEFDETTYRAQTYQRTEGKTPDVLFEPINDLSDLGHPFASNSVMAGGLSSSIAPRLHHVQVRKLNPPRNKQPPDTADLVRSDGEWAFQLTVLDNDGDHEVRDHRLAGSLAVVQPLGHGSL